jgi:hypothetical protein
MTGSARELLIGSFPWYHDGLVRLPVTLSGGKLRE